MGRRTYQRMGSRAERNGSVEWVPFAKRCDIESRSTVK